MRKCCWLTLSSKKPRISVGYRVVGGLAVFVHVDRRDPMAARLTKDVDVAIHREDLDRIRQALEPHGFTFRHAAGVDMFVDAGNPGARGAVRVLFAGEWIRPTDPEPLPDSEPSALLKVSSSLPSPIWCA
jgi:hypothetical protein